MFSGSIVLPDSKETELGSSNQTASPSARILVVWIFSRSLGVICYDKWVLIEGHKNYFKDWWTHSLPFWLHLFWLTYSGGTDRQGELYYNFSISNDLTQMVNFPTWIPDCDSHSPALLDFFLSCGTSICSSMAFPPLGSFDHVVASVSIDFPINWKQDTPFHHIVYDFSCADWNGFCDNLSDVQRSLNSVLLLLLVRFVSRF